MLIFVKQSPTASNHFSFELYSIGDDENEQGTIFISFMKNQSRALNSLKKTDSEILKYVGVCVFVLVIAAISVGVAYMSIKDTLKSQVKEDVNELPNKEYMKQVVSNITGVKYPTHVFSNISSTSIEKMQANMDLLSKGKHLKNTPKMICLLEVISRNE